MIEDAIKAAISDALQDAVAPLAAEIASLRRALDARVPEPWVSRAEAARVRGCSVDTIDREISAGVLQVQRIGTRGVRVRLPARPEADEVTRLAREARGR